MGVFLDSWCKHTGSHMSYFETSAKDATNVAFAFNEMAEKALARITSEKKQPQTSKAYNPAVQLDKADLEGGGCCS